MLVWLYRAVDGAQVHVAKLILGTCLAEFSPVVELVDKLERRLDMQFIVQPPSRRHLHRFFASRMTADAVGPEAGPKPFRCAALLQQQFALRVEKEQRKRTMQHPAIVMALGFGQIPGFIVISIDKDQFLSLRRYDFVRTPHSRFPLPRPGL